MKTVQDIIKTNSGYGHEIRFEFWSDIQRLINTCRYRAAMLRILDNCYDDDYPTQLRCVAESIARHIEGK